MSLVLSEQRNFAPHSPLASSSGPLDDYSGQGPSAPLQANFRPTQTISQPTGQLEVGEDGAVFLTHVMCSHTPRDTIGVSKWQWS
jgi:hypothetical protein